MIDLVGGRGAFDVLDDRPLGDVAVEWSVIPAAVRPQTDATREVLDNWAIELFDAEVRTIARHVLVCVVLSDPGLFKRSARVDVLAAGILAFLLRRLTGRFSVAELRQLSWAVFTQKDLAAATGVSASTISGRTRTIANIVDRADIDWPKILHSTQRREALESKRRIKEWRQRRT